MGSPLPPEILRALTRGQTILTANQRAARSIRSAYDAHQQAAGAAMWAPPAVLAIDNWLTALHHQLTLDGHEARLLLNAAQEHTLWRGIIAADPAVSGLRPADSLAEMAAGAWKLLHLHNGFGRLGEFHVSTDTRAFQRWAREFDRACVRHDYVTGAQLPASVNEALAEGWVAIPDAGLMLVDFDAVAPAHASLFEAIGRAGFDVDSLIVTAETISSSLVTLQDDAAELRAAARWAREQIARVGATNIAVVVPGLADRRAQIERAFSEMLTPEAFEFSLGEPLAETAAVAVALDLLRWTLEPLELGRIRTLLLSPFFGAVTVSEGLASAEFDAFELPGANLLQPELPLEAMTGLVFRAERAPRLQALLNRLQALRDTAAEEQMRRATQAHAGWAEAFRNVLDAAGWTAATLADSLSFQTRRRWESALDELATLDFDGSQVAGAEALQTLTRIARKAVFAPESRGAAVQIVGPLEPGGTTFDALWFLSADDQSWPTPGAVHPFIPWHVQRELGVGGADPERANALAQAVTGRLAHASHEVVFSYARHSEEGERRPSPLLRSLGLAMLEPTAEPGRAALTLEVFDDSEPLPPLPAGVTPGGARILELQAACSFRAFAEMRLHSTQPDARELGLDARDRGIQVHRIMQGFWDVVRSQESLRNLTTGEREAILDASIETAIARAASAARTPWEDAYLDVQRRRLRALLHPWLEFELTRPAFEVRQQEEKRIAKIGPLALELRADRIDETMGGPLILDYKTGSATPSDWKSERPEAPQLPLYAVLSEDADRLGGVAFALLRAGDEMALKGFADSPAVLDSRSKMEFATLHDQMEDWHRVLTTLAEAFAHDDPIASPKEYPKTCQRCSQRMLCRLDPATLSADEGDEESEGVDD